ncbi:restriction endonuclease subunit S [Clostridium sp.]|uniref:restriction endonuclease subunit S n=1 Tax=Clostridium sp. TaxID=1506 RepID=UPI0029021243|nr:restriction endonuclease subunit S [Clostridium sp.]MDU2897101.1 restriction endonuclease subunit S [Clostridium sp.]
MEFIELAELCDKGSSNLAQKDLVFDSGIYPVYGAPGEITKVDFFHQSKPYLGLIKDGAGVGRVMQLPANSSVIGTIQYIFPKENVDLKYLYYLIKYLDLGKSNTGATIPHIYFKDYKKRKVKVREYGEQKHIGQILELIDSHLSAYKNVLDQYDLLIKSRFDEFNKNNNNVKVLKLEAICTSIVRGPFGSALKVENFVKKSDTSVKVYEQSNAIQKSAVIGSRYISRDHYESLKRFKCKPGDIIMSCSGTIGKLFILPNDAEEGIINQALCKFTLGKDLLPEVFLLYMDILIGNIEIKGSGIKNISAVKFIKNLEIPVPPIGIQSKLLFELNQINKLKSDVQKSIDETQLLMDSLMQEYFG